MADDNIDLRFLGQQVLVLQTDMRALRAGETRRDNAVAAVQAELKEMRAENLAKFERIDARFDAVDSRFNSVDAHFEAIDARFDAIDARFGGVDVRFISIDRRFASIDLQFKQMAETAAINLEIVLTAIAALKKSNPQQRNWTVTNAPEWDHDRAKWLIGKHILCSVTHVAPDGHSVTAKEQFHGMVVSATEGVGIAVVCLSGENEGKTVSLPPITTAFQDAKPGKYRLKATGETVTNPDAAVAWTVTQTTKH